MAQEFEQIELEEYDRQFHHIQNLRRLDFFEPSYQYISYDEKDDFSNRRPKESIISTQSTTDEQSVVEKGLFLETEQTKDDFREVTPTSASIRAIDIINQKISKLDSFFATVKAVKAVGRPSSYEPVLDEKTREQIALNKENEQKQINLWSGIFSMKSVIYNKKSLISPPPLLKNLEEDSEVKKAPRLVELYQYPGLDTLDSSKLPNEINLKDVQVG